MPGQTQEQEPLVADRRFFGALLAADVKGLGEILADDFLLIDVLQGGEIPRQALLEAVASGFVRFEAIEVLESRERRYGSTAIVTGCTEMRGKGGEQSWSARSRYAHVFVEQAGRWRLVSAQGTRIEAG